uniref:Uncharacterized protein n=1 Tax=Pundamilia nyererei TaxID=303518 RepID=A0A3B4GLU4_9CICH
MCRVTLEPLSTFPVSRMASWASLSVHKVPVTLFILMYIDVLRCQPFTIPFRTPSDCGAEEFFDISSLSCVRCGPNQRRRLSCVCQSGYKTVTTDKASISCEKCLPNKPGVTKDGFGCIRCPGGLSNDGKCQCPPGDVLGESLVIGMQ